MSENNPLSDGTAAREIDYVVHLRPGRERSVLRRHPWVFAGAIERLEERDTARPGGLGAVHGADGRQLGVSIVNPGAQLALRMLRWDAGPIDADWFAGALRRAGALRERVVPQDTNAYRLLNAEGDGLPGLIIDRYADTLVVQCTALGMSRLDALWLAALKAAFPGHTILDRSQRARSDANLVRKDGTLHGEAPAGPVEVREGGLRFRVDLAAGQKTGFYLDQRENRGRIAALCRGGRMLNAFAYTGSFAVWAGAHGAREVTCVDTSAAALALAQENWNLNGLPGEGLRVVRGRAGDYLRAVEERFDVIVLDPPAFAKQHTHVARAARAYKDINLWAMKRLAPGGYLATFSCSQHVGADLFQKIVFGASLDAQVSLQWLQRFGAGPDHPVHLDHPQGEYLKGYLLRSLAAS